MSCHLETKTFEEIEEVRIECCDKEEIEALEKNIILAIEQKLEKLNILIKNCNVYNYGGYLLVNDRYNICSSLPEVATAFGLNVKTIECSLRGKNYLISDNLLNTLKQFDRSFEFGQNVANQEASSDIRNIINLNSTQEFIDEDILAMVRNIKINGQYVTSKKRTVTETYLVGEGYDRLESSSANEWVSNADEIRRKLLELSKDSQNIVNKANEQLRDGTAKLIYARAKQMGYAVQEVKKGTQVQLVLVRCE